MVGILRENENVSGSRDSHSWSLAPAIQTRPKVKMYLLKPKGCGGVSMMNSIPCCVQIIRKTLGTVKVVFILSDMGGQPWVKLFSLPTVLIWSGFVLSFSMTRHSSTAGYLCGQSYYSVQGANAFVPVESGGLFFDVAHKYCLSGLQNWRDGPLNHNRFWEPTGPHPPPPLAVELGDGPIGSGCSLAEMGAVVLNTRDPLTKSKLSHMAYSRWRQQILPIGVSQPPPRPARPLKPLLVSPKEIPDSKNSGLPLNVYMLHNLAHVELNAIDLAWDTNVWFSPYTDLLGEGFFVVVNFAHVAVMRVAILLGVHRDWLSLVSAMETCQLIGSEKSSDNVASHLAAIPLVQEARERDAGPRVVQKLVGCGLKHCGEECR
ncbi:diiron containing four-helix bundle family ferritin protein, putative [Actinidia rufa]|uniref:Diiron containing four-helix bundle family ferritin protein, putative n=1 Tax=Actinidia rufa TaxID=165716 RepID=A0A7J0GQ04_9ERIC|nr:diiron containing four-helix bundle family ferritin protein, putative [Actinidia rufa]